MTHHGQEPGAQSTANGNGAAPDVEYAVVIPTVGRHTLHECLQALAGAKGPQPREIVLVDDRPHPQQLDGELSLDALGPLRERTLQIQTGGRGPAAARDTGWRTVRTPWTVFLDDDVRVSPTWCKDLVQDLTAAGPYTAGVQATLVVPLPEGRRPTDWERGTAGLADSLFITADMAYRTEALEAVGGFDERFPRAFREDADLALRMLNEGWLIEHGERRTEHPVRPSDRWASVRQQRGNADDALMRRRHGRDWYSRASAPRGRIRRHASVTVAGAAALALTVTGHRRAAAVAALGWAAGTAEFAGARIAPGPRTRDEVVTMLATSAVIPPLAVWHRLRGEARHRGVPQLSARHGNARGRAVP